MKRILYILTIVFACSATVKAQEDNATRISTIRELTEKVDVAADNSMASAADSAIIDIEDKVLIASLDSAASLLPAINEKKLKRDWATWVPEPKKALWLGIVLPGAGQIYNRKYWKLPIVYGGIVGCVYAWRWNNMMYTDYSRAYIDLMDDDPTTNSYNSFMHIGAQITDSNKSRYEDLFKRRKDTYRRYRDLSIFCLIGVYALSIIDAYVDASLSQFDISRDLSLRVEPTVIKNHSTNNPLEGNSLGVNVGLRF